MTILATPFARLLAGGLAAALLALIAWIGDHRRRRRRDPDAVGFMPWTDVFVGTSFAACVLLGVAARLWFGGGTG